MNLIEQLGGYDAAKEKYQSLSDSDVITIGPFEVPAKPYFKDELLEYRRQHNIFEVGDWIVMDSHKPEYQFYQITKDDMGSHWINLVEFRHATDAEIKAGKRLEVK
ncbi:hypothetical protein [Acinetobacter cumulans]|uniref:hypothetical protein n=1 Tax=Acinetobacter cumulans TaxID=2136182 RepID=UPI0014439FDC|nr:hypothetical protein [Acinetobacter cumulans]